MSALLDDSLVALLLLTSCVYAFATLGPKRTWRRMLAMFAALLARAPTTLRLHAAAQRLASAARGKTQGACGGCDNCGSEKSPPPSGSDSGRVDATRTDSGRGDTARTDATRTEIRVPIANIARLRRSQQD